MTSNPNSARNSGYRQSSATEPKLLSIGNVLEILCKEFPALTISKLRFLEEQGHVTPLRTSSGYRKFTEQHVQRIRFILSLQQSQYLPHRVIRERLEELDSGEISLLNPPITSSAKKSSRYTRAEVILAAGAPAGLVDEVISAQFIPPADSFDENSLAVLRLFVELSSFGIEPRHLLGLRKHAEREAEFAVHVLSRSRRKSDPTDIERAEDNAFAIARALSGLHTIIVGNSIPKLLR